MARATSCLFSSDGSPSSHSRPPFHALHVDGHGARVRKVSFGASMPSRAHLTRHCLCSVRAFRSRLLSRVVPQPPYDARPSAECCRPHARLCAKHHHRVVFFFFILSFFFFFFFFSFGQLHPFSRIYYKLTTAAHSRLYMTLLIPLPFCFSHSNCLGRAGLCSQTMATTVTRKRRPEALPFCGLFWRPPRRGSRWRSLRLCARRAR